MVISALDRHTLSPSWQFLDKVGVVHRITDKGDVRVQYEGYATRWTIHPRALARVTSYSPGDVVTVISDVAKVKEFQKGHGEWIEYMIGVSIWWSVFALLKLFLWRFFFCISFLLAIVNHL